MDAAKEHPALVYADQGRVLADEGENASATSQKNKNQPEAATKNILGKRRRRHERCRYDVPPFVLVLITLAFMHQKATTVRGALPGAN